MLSVTLLLYFEAAFRILMVRATIGSQTSSKDYSPNMSNKDIKHYSSLADDVLIHSNHQQQL